MSEAIIIYRGRGGSVDPELLKPQTITSNGTYEAPVTGNYWVAAVGGGGGGGGGCRNSWNSSQVFYGAGGTRGTLNAGTVFLNQGDKVTIGLGSGGAGGTNNTTVVSNNSRGTNGGTGGTSTFGSYKSSSGGTWGGWSWSYHGWSNTYTWNNTVTGWNNTIVWNNVITGYSQVTRWQCVSCGWVTFITPSSLTCRNCLRGTFGKQVANVPAWSNTYNWVNTQVWSNKQVWNNRIVNTSTRCYTSIQIGSWWYLDNETVSTTGTRTYSGDGGSSGSAGNAGFMVIIPPTI